MKQSLIDFTKEHGITVLNEKLGYFQRQDLYFTDPKDANVVVTEPNSVPERILVVEIPERSLEKFHHVFQKNLNYNNTGSYNLAMAIIEKEWAEHELRLQFPAVQEAWQAYSLLLHLAKNHKTP